MSQTACSKVGGIKRVIARKSIVYGGETSPTTSFAVVINTVADLEAQLPLLCKEVLQCLGKKNLESTYQRALRCELSAAGCVVHDEVSIDITYKGTVIGSRRADLIVHTRGDGKYVVIELKAVAEGSFNRNGEHLKQLEYYMFHFDISDGYLINFPHESSFPDISYEEPGWVFKAECVMGAVNMSDRVMRSDTVGAADCPQIIRVRKASETEIMKSQRHAVEPDKSHGVSSPPKRVSTIAVPATAPATAPTAASTVAASGYQVPLTLKGEPCKNCMKKAGGYCHLHIKAHLQGKVV